MKTNLKLIMTLITIAAVLLNSACKRKLDIEQEDNYYYEIKLASVNETIQRGETVTLQFSILHHNYEGAAFKFRYLQSEGQGVLTEGSTLLEMDQEYAIPEDGKITLKYRSDCDIAQTLNFSFFDRFNNQKEYTVQFDPVVITDPDYTFQVDLEPFKEKIRAGEQTELKFTLTPQAEGATYKFYYSQSEGTGQLTSPEHGKINSGQNYDLFQGETITLHYTSSCHVNQKLVFTFSDNYGNTVGHTVLVEDMPSPYFTINAPANVFYPISGAAKLNFSIDGIDLYDSKEFKFSYNQTSGNGTLTGSDGSLLNRNQFYAIPENGQFTLQYSTKSGGSRLHTLEFTIEDSYGNRQEHRMTVTL